MGRHGRERFHSDLVRVKQEHRDWSLDLQVKTDVRESMSKNGRAIDAVYNPATRTLELVYPEPGMIERIELRKLCEIPENAWGIARRTGDWATIQKYAAMVTAPPPIEIATDLRILDGFHRVIVSIAKGHRTIEAVRITQRWPGKNSESEKS